MEINLNIEIDEIPKKLRNELGRALLHNGYRKRRKILFKTCYEKIVI